MQPLAGVRVLAVEQYGAGPFGTMYLANQGAEVIKIENPRDGGDMSRAVGPHFLGPEDSEFFHSFNANKHSMTIDLQSSQGRELFLELVKTADAVSNNLRGDVPEKLGLDYKSLQATNPKIVCAHLTAYGRTGSRNTWPGFDYLMQAEAGWFSVTGEPGTPPARFGLSVVDMMTGLAMAFGLVSAIVAARSTGAGRDMDVSLFDLALHNTSYLSTWYLNEGVVTERLPRSAHPSLTPCQLYTTADGWIFIMCNKEKFWPILCHKLNQDGWAEDPRFKVFKGRLEHRDVIQTMLDEELSKKTTADWLQIFAGTVPAAPINDIGQAMNNPFVHERNAIHEFPHPVDPSGHFKMVAHPIKSSGEKPLQRPAPKLGADTDRLLKELGIETSRIQELKEKGVI
ncbi:MAG: CoA transferase [Rhodospirillaceae bacterium]|nr:CoA transferase [Rhodospirillaceae bacterium]|tara:strand:+ start:118 stop:1311 length:1194 start_codon:yes stop_codon:yes gene_type:complete